MHCIKHVFPENLLLQFECTNTLNDQLLENVTVNLEIPDGYEIQRILPCPRLEYNSGSGCIYVILAQNSGEMSDLVGTFTPTLKFVVKDCDPTTGEFLSFFVTFWSVFLIFYIFR